MLDEKMAWKKEGRKKNEDAAAKRWNVGGWEREVFAARFLLPELHAHIRDFNLLFPILLLYARFENEVSRLFCMLGLCHLFDEL